MKPMQPTYQQHMKTLAKAIETLHRTALNATPGPWQWELTHPTNTPQKEDTHWANLLSPTNTAGPILGWLKDAQLSLEQSIPKWFDQLGATPEQLGQLCIHHHGDALRLAYNITERNN